MKKTWTEIYGPFIGKLNLNIGCGESKEAGTDEIGWVNLDMNREVSPDVIHNILCIPYPFQDSTFDCVLASHVMEHVPKSAFLEVMAEVYRITKPGGHFIGITPFGTSYDGWENPHHVQMFGPGTWAYVTPIAYQGKTAGEKAHQGRPVRNWQIVQRIMVPEDEFRDDRELEWKAKHLQNVIRELHVVLKKGGEE